MIELVNVSQIYNPKTVIEIHALEDINFKITEGEFVALIGHTGSGKSTLIQLMNGLIKPTSGKVLYKGQDIHEKSFKKNKLRAKVGLVFQYPEYQIFEESIYKEVAFGPKNMGVQEPELDINVKAALKVVGIDESLYEKSPFFLSGGQKRRIAIASVLAMQPELLILDEPAAGLDPRGKRLILDGIKKLNKKFNISILMVSHSMEDVSKYADRIVVMNKGRIVMDDVPREIFSRQKELQNMNLDIPGMARILHTLKSRGLNVDDRIFDVVNAKKEILRAVKND